MPREPAAEQPPWLVQERRAIGERVRARREYANLTQEQLEEAAGVTRLTLQKIESGATDARISWLLRIARALDVHVLDLLG